MTLLAKKSDDEANFTQEEALLGLGHPDTATANLTVDTPIKDPKRLQLEADLWQARLGHCGDWQLKMIPQSVNGTPTHFNPHPFSTYDHYNQARIRKIPATKGKHPSRATLDSSELPSWIIRGQGIRKTGLFFPSTVTIPIS